MLSAYKEITNLVKNNEGLDGIQNVKIKITSYIFPFWSGSVFALKRGKSCVAILKCFWYLSTLVK